MSRLRLSLQAWRDRIAWQDAAAALLFFLLPLLFFWPVTLGGQTLLPLDNLLTSEPLASYAEAYGVETPHNSLVSDLVLQNYVWKRFTIQTLKGGELPLWNPHILGGVPFLAAGQHSALYPLSLLFYFLPLSQAYGWFTVIQLFMTSLFMYLFLRVLGVNRLGSILGALTYTFSLFMVVRLVFPMIIAAVSWLPLLLLAVEQTVRCAEEQPCRSPVPYAILGSIALGCEWLAGHVEITYFILLVMGAYAAWRLIGVWWRQRRTLSPQVAWHNLARTGLWLLLMVLLGVGLTAVQVVPLYELVRTSFRQGSVTLQEVLSWAYPLRRVIAFFIPDFFGNPTHHTYWDVFTRSIQPVTTNAAGQSIDTIYWGIKNYVEGGSYMGLLPLALALVAVIGQGIKRRGEAEAPRVRTQVRFFAGLAIFSLALVFGTPLYALIYALPGLSQSHSPFRWMLPCVFSVSVLAGVGAHYLSGVTRRMTSVDSPWTLPNLGRWLGWLMFWGGAAVLGALAVSWVMPTQAVALAERVMMSLAKAPEAFADGAMFYSYQFRNLSMFGAVLACSGAVLRLSCCPIYLPKWLGGYAAWKPLAVVVLICDLFLVGYGFNAAADPAILDIQPRVIQFLQQDQSLYRITTYDTQSRKPLPANEGMYYDLYDIRGYDSIIPKRYTQLMGLIEEQSELQYNRIARLRHPESLDSALLDMLNVKYVLTEETIERPGYTLVADEELRVYRNDDVMPRAWLAYEAEVWADEPSLFARLRTFDPRQTVLFEEPIPALGAMDADAASALGEVRITDYGANEVRLAASLPITGALVLADSHFPDWTEIFQGWKAYAIEPGAEEEQALRIYRVNGNLRGVILGPGDYQVRLTYTPMSLKFGLFLSFFSGTILLMLGVVWGWQRYYDQDAGQHVLHRIAKNTGSSIVLNLVNRAVDMAFAMFMLRVLLPENAGKLSFAVVLVSWFEIVTNFGLNTLLTRDVSRDKAHANRYLANTTVIRLGLCTLVFPAMLALMGVWRQAFGLSSDTGWAIILFTIGLIPSGISTGLTAVFTAYEKMEYPAIVSTMTTLLRVAGGTLVLLLGWGFVGIAGVSIAVNLVTMTTLLLVMVKQCFRPHVDFDLGLQKRLLGEAYPLMLNHLLATVFFKTDYTLLKALQGDRTVGYYSTAYKPIDALTIIPSYFTMALFPLMSRYANSATESLNRAYQLAVRFLLALALPIMLIVFFAAEPLIRLLGGSAYLPQSMIALQLLIFFLPFSFINGVTQYVLIALEQQRFLTRAYGIVVAFNLTANIIFIPVYGFRASAVITVLSELVLMVPFFYGIHRHLGRIPWFKLIWQPVFAGAAMAAAVWLLQGMGLLLALPAGLVVYGLALMALGVFGPRDRQWIRRLVQREGQTDEF